MYTDVKGACVAQNVPLQCDGWTCLYYEMLSNNKSEVFCPNLAEQLRVYITGCHVCQLFKKGKNLIGH